MQITTIHKLQYALDTSMKVLRFVWRHALTIGVFALLFAAFAMYPAIDWNTFLVELIVAVGLDKFKMQFKASRNNGNLAQEQIFESSKWSRTTQMGSAWDSYDPGSPAYHIRHDRYC